MKSSSNNSVILTSIQALKANAYPFQAHILLFSTCTERHCWVKDNVWMNSVTSVTTHFI